MSGLRKRTHEQLADKYIIKKVKGLADGELKGSGAFGLVRAVSVGGTICIAKRIHDILQDPRVPPGDRESVKEKFHNECKMLSELRHPNIVHFVGVHYDKHGNITLIMEALHTDLRGFFLQDEPDISIKLGILSDVSYGLLYLHSHHPTAIIHRDLNPGNILLTRNLTAKIADLGVSSYLSAAKVQTMAPGAWDYMPPEALRENPAYDTSLDVFSFGHVALCVGNHCVLNIGLPSVGATSGSSVKRRKKYLDSLGPKHCISSLAVDCLQDSPHKRPIARELCDRLQKLCYAHPRNSSEVDVKELHQAVNHFQLATLAADNQPSCSHEADENEPYTTVLPTSSDMFHGPETTDEVTSHSLQQKIEELISENKELRNIADAEKAKAEVYKTDFEIERGDREKAHSEIDNYKFQLAKLQEKFTQMEEQHRHQRAEMHVLKAATIRQAEELRKLHLERDTDQQQFGGTPTLPTKNKQIMLPKSPAVRCTPAVMPLESVRQKPPTVYSRGGHMTTGTGYIPPCFTAPSSSLTSSEPPLPPRAHRQLRPTNSIHDFRGIPDNYQFPGHVYEKII